jgi:GAF domain-containing protein/HAMP domain-containing protein
MYNLKNPRSVTITTRLLFAFLLIGLIPLTIVTLVAYANSEQALRQEIASKLDNLAGDKARQIETYSIERQRDVSVLADTPDIVDTLSRLHETLPLGPQSPEFAAIETEARPFLTQYTRKTGYLDLFLIAPNGDALFSIYQGDLPGTNLYNGSYSDTELVGVFDRAKTLLQTEISDFGAFPATEEAAAFIAAPVFKEGVVIGVIALQISNEQLYRVVNDLAGLGETGETLVGRRNGDEILFLAPTRYDPNAAFTRVISFGDVEGLLLQNATRGIKDVQTAIDYRGQEVIGATAYLPSLRWGMVVKLDTAEAFAAIVNLRNVVAILAGVLIAVVVIVAIRVARSISLPILKLTSSAQQLSQGNFAVEIPVHSSDEIGQLADSFRSMTSELQGLVSTLEERIASRTRDLQTVAEVSTQVSTVLEPERLLRDISDLTKERFGLYHSHIYLLNDRGDTLVLTAGAGYVGRQMVSEHRTIAYENPQSIVAQSARSRKAVIVDDVRQSPTFLPHKLLPDTRSEMAVPLVARGQLLGVLDVQSNQVAYFDENALATFDLMAGQISAAISNAQLYATAERTSRHERALGQIDRSIQGANNMDEILQATVRELGKALRVPYTAIELQLEHDGADAEEKVN